ncbi:uncharacterized protein LOC144906465 [Branchiostoma floridae x Branchiostoma belcheri]
MPRGSKNRQSSQFKKGHTPWNRGQEMHRETQPDPPTYQRPTEEQYHLLVNTDRQGEPIEDLARIAVEESRPPLLRPKKEPSKMDRILGIEEDEDGRDEEDEEDDTISGYRYWLGHAAMKACATAQRQHDDRSSCRKLIYASAKREETRGIVSSETFVCNACEYVSQSYKCYEEVDTGKRGKKLAAPNMALQIALFNNPIGPKNFMEIAATLDLPVPSLSGMQKMANRYAEIIVEENDKDMKRWGEIVLGTNEVTGKPADRPIKGEGDVRFQSALSSGRGRRPGQPSSHAFATFAENETNMKKILATYLRNKQCAKCNLGHVGRGVKKSHSCSANIAKHVVIGDEAALGREMGKKLVENNIRVSHLVHDGDGHIFKGMSEVMEEETGEPTKSLSDNIHLSRSIARAVTKATWSAHMWPGKTRAERMQVKNRFGDDLKLRLEAEHRQAREKYGKNKERMEEAMNKASDAIVNCYLDGDHTLCRTQSLVCSGSSKVWDFSFFPHGTKELICPDEADREELRTIIGKRLDPEVLEATRFGLNTNRAESANRQYSKSVPKNRTLTTTLAGHYASAVHSANNGTALSILMKRQAAGIPLSPRSPAVTALRAMDKIETYKRAYHKEPARRSRRKTNRVKEFQSYNEAKDIGHYKSKGEEEEEGEKAGPSEPKKRRV